MGGFKPSSGCASWFCVGIGRVGYAWGSPRRPTAEGCPMDEEALRRALADTALAAEFRAWRRGHPEATLTEIERELDARLAVARAGLLAAAAVDVPDGDPCCPARGGPLQRRGERTRTVRTVGDARVPLTRAYPICPACDAGVSPPR